MLVFKRDAVVNKMVASSVIKAKIAVDFKALLKHHQMFLMLLPGLAALIIFNYVPMYGITLAFKDYNMMDGINASPWVGLEHVRNLFGYADFYKAFRNTLVISLLKLAFGFPMPIILALMLNEMKNKTFKRVIQTFSYLPHFFSWVVLSGIIIMLFSTSGPVNMIIKTLTNGVPYNFFGDKGLFLALLILSAVWQGMGWGSIIYLATLSGLDESIYEAAYIDGANRWKQTIYISIPGLIPTIITVFILNLGNVLNAGFDQIYNMYNPIVYDVSDIIDTYVLRKLQQSDFSLGTAVGLFKSVVGLILVLGSNWLFKKVTNNEQGIL